MPYVAPRGAATCVYRILRDMCGRYLRRSDKQQIAETFHLNELPDESDGLALAPDFNVAPATFQPVIRLNRETGAREVVSMRWGLVPHFAKSLADFKGFSTINAKAETVMSRALWRIPFERRRCLVPADGFYEWAKPTPKQKKPYVFTMRSGEPFAFAGLWDAWRDPSSGNWLQTFSVITTVPNELTVTVHDRMPVILHARDYTRWLDRGETAQLPVDLLRPYEADAMQANPCNPAVGNVRNHGPELLVCPAENDALPLLNSL